MADHREMFLSFVSTHPLLVNVILTLHRYRLHMMKLVLVIAALECISTGIYFTTLSLLMLVASCSVLSLGYVGAKRFHGPLLMAYFYFRLFQFLLASIVFFWSYFSPYVWEYFVPFYQLDAYFYYGSSWSIVLILLQVFRNALVIYSAIMALRLRRLVVLNQSSIDILSAYLERHADPHAQEPEAPVAEDCPLPSKGGDDHVHEHHDEHHDHSDDSKPAPPTPEETCCELTPPVVLPPVGPEAMYYSFSTTMPPTPGSYIPAQVAVVQYPVLPQQN